MDKERYSNTFCIGLCAHFQRENVRLSKKLKIGSAFFGSQTLSFSAFQWRMCSQEIDFDSFRFVDYYSFSCGI